jgi:hypothetical protein
MSNDWWSRKMGDPAPTQRTSSPPMRPPSVPNVRYVPEGQVSSAPLMYDPQQDVAITKANSANTNNSDRCPECNSGNYMRMTGAGSTIRTQNGSAGTWRCYDCGYPLIQSGSGVGMPSGSEGQATPAIQPHKGNNYNPGTIIGKV